MSEVVELMRQLALAHDRIAQLEAATTQTLDEVVAKVRAGDGEGRAFLRNGEIDLDYIVYVTIHALGMRLDEAGRVVGAAAPAVPAPRPPRRYDDPPGGADRSRYPGRRAGRARK